MFDLNYIFSQFLLIYSVQRLRKLVKQMGSPEVTNREAIMLVHTILYSIFILIIAANTIVEKLSEEWKLTSTYCRYVYASDVISVVLELCNDSIWALFFYMTWRQLILVQKK